MGGQQNSMKTPNNQDRKRKMKRSSTFAVVAFSAAVLMGTFLCAAEPATERTPVIARYEEMRYGMFIQFGMNTFIDIDQFGRSSCGAPEGPLPPSETYHPTDLDVDQWIAVAKKAGMRYALLTAKPYIGHALWDSECTDYDVATSGDKTDIVAEFVKACRKYAVAPCLYYSLGVDAAHRRDKHMTESQWYEHANNQITELLTKYGPISVMWFDGMGPASPARLQEAYDTVKSLQPDCLVMLNQGYTDGTHLRHWPTDLVSGERTRPPFEGHNARMEHNGKTYYIPMEVCETSAVGTFSKGWFWEAGERLKEVQRELLRLHRGMTGRGANLLLNVAIDREGRVPAATVQRLLELDEAINSKDSAANS
ncbi:MAG: hypothetical protein GWP08_21560, partial [Nitrospiraceae bacterium]|nr:hypothetical protein [Nitrospiraceae bacterium]